MEKVKKCIKGTWIKTEKRVFFRKEMSVERDQDPESHPPQILPPALRDLRRKPVRVLGHHELRWDSIDPGNHKQKQILRDRLATHDQKPIEVFGLFALFEHSASRCEAREPDLLEGQAKQTGTCRFRLCVVPGRVRPALHQVRDTWLCGSGGAG